MRVIVKIDGNQEISVTTSSAQGFNQIRIGNTAGDGGGPVHDFDDIAINDNTGSYQNTWPGPASVVRLTPTGAGESTAWSKFGGEATNWETVDDFPPTGATGIFSSTLNQTDWYQMSDIPAVSKKINVVEAGCSIASGFGGSSTLALQFQTANGGTVSASSGFAPSNTTFVFNSTNTPRNNPLVTYTDPDGAAWTYSTINSLQAGVKITTSGADATNVHSVWVMVEVADFSISGISSISSIASVGSTV